MRSKNNVTIQINSLEALERLIGKDNELEVSIRNSIVQDFSKHYLKSVANEFAKNYTQNKTKAIFDEAIKDYFEGYNSHFESELKLKNRVINIIEKQLEGTIRKIAGDDYRELANKIQDYGNKLKDHMTYVINERINNEASFKDIINAAINEYFNKRFK